MRRILVCVDGSPRSLHVLDSAMRIARESGGRVRLLHVVHVPLDFPSATMWPISGESLEDQSLRIGREVAKELAKEVPKDCLSGVEVRIGVPWRQICEAAKEFDVDLVVIGAHGYGIVDRTLGTTAASVVNHADRDVLVIRDRTAPGV